METGGTAETDAVETGGTAETVQRRVVGLQRPCSGEWWTAETVQRRLVDCRDRAAETGDWRQVETAKTSGNQSVEQLICI